MTEDSLLKRIAEACSRDLGKEVLPGDVYGFLLFGMEYQGLQRFNTEEVSDLVATIIKESYAGRRD